MAAARSYHLVARLLLILLLHQVVESTFKTRRATVEVKPKGDSPPSGWQNFLSKIQKPFRTIDSALLLLGGSKGTKPGPVEDRPGPVEDRPGPVEDRPDPVEDRPDRPNTAESTTPSTKASVSIDPMARMIMDPKFRSTPKSGPRVTKPSTATTAVPLSVDAPTWNLERLSKDPCGASPANITDGEMHIFLGQFPWLALLRFTDENGTMENLCGGSLINDRYVLTAASCLEIPGYKLTSVRLGEYNLDFYDTDCSDVDNGLEDVIAIEMCYGDPPVDYGVSSTHAHPKYDSTTGEYNVGLIRLAEKVEYTPLISPVCLPVGDMAISWNIGISTSNLILAGWGENPVPREGFVYQATPYDCEDAIGDVVTEGQMCGIGEDGGALCHGDIGGPLFSLLKMRTTPSEKRYVQLGLLVSKSAYCQDEPPLIFDNVERFLPWMLKTMKP